MMHDDWPEVAGNIKKVRRCWGRLAWVLGREGADPKVSWNFYTAVTQKVLLFGAETWVLTGKMELALDAFQGNSIFPVRTLVSAPKSRTFCVTAV